MSDRVLSAERLFDATLPGRWSGILDGLAQLYEHKKDKDSSFEERCAAGRPVYRRLLDDSSLLVEPTPEQMSLSTEHFRLWFTEAVLLWMQLAETGSPPIVDTIDTRTLDDFPLDLPLDPAATGKVREALRSAFEWTDDALADVERRIAYVTANLELKRAISSAIAERYTDAGRPTPADCVQLMQALYGPTPWSQGDVDLVVTSTTVFFCIRRTKGVLDEPGYDERPEAQRKAIGDFIAALKEANVAETKRFPAFGLFDCDLIDQTFVEELAAKVDADVHVVKATLATMVSVLRTQEVELYLVHDTWGHAWQEALSEFEWEYALMADLNAPFAPDDGPEYGGADAPTLASAFVERDGRTELDEPTLLRFADADLKGRIQIGVSAALAEMLADFMESKYARVCPDSAMPTSSLMPTSTLKLDLSLADTRRPLRRLRDRYQTLAEKEDARDDLVQALAATGLPEAGLRESVVTASALMWRTFGPRLAFGLGAEPVDGDDDAIVSTVYRRVMLKLLLVVVELERSLDTLGARADPPWTDPTACPDLMALCMSHFYERDRQRKFWNLDQVVRTELPAALVRLRDAIRSGA